MVQEKAEIFSDFSMSPFSGEVLSGRCEGLPFRHHRHHQPIEVKALRLLAHHAVGLVLLALVSALAAWLVNRQDAISAPPRSCPACKEATDFLDSVSEPLVSPCDDFYEHVCGRWSEPSFEEALTSHGLEALRDRLVRYPRPNDPEQRVYKTFDMLASYYRSCYQDMEGLHDIDYFVKRFSDTTGLGWATLVAKSRNNELVDVLVAMSARYAVAVLIKIITLELKTSFGVAPLGDNELISATTMAGLADQAAAAISGSSRDDDRHSIVKRTRELHQKVLKAYQDRERNESTILDAARTAFPLLNIGDTTSWLEAVRRHTRETLNVTEDSTVALESPKLLKTTLRHFALADDVARSVYLYAHVINAVTAIHELNVKVAGRPEVAGEECLRRLNVKELSAVHRSFAVSTLASPRTVSRVKEMMTQVTLQLVKQVSSNARIKSSARIVLSQSLQPYSYKNVFSGPYLNMTRLEGAYEAFPVSPNLYQEGLWHARFLVPGELLDTCLGEVLLADFSQEMCLTPFVLLPPMLYAGAERFINYASLGFVIASRIVHGFFSPKPRTAEVDGAVSSVLELSAECHNRSGDIGGPEDVIDAVSFILGLRAALEAYKTWAEVTSGVPTTPDVLRTFFRRACLTVCSASPSSKPHGSDNFTPKRACNMAVRSAPEFYEAFHCGIGSDMSRDGICTLF